MSSVTATEAARNFSDLLTQVEHSGVPVEITRRGRTIAVLTKAHSAGPAQERFADAFALLDGSEHHDVLTDLFGALADLGCSLVVPTGWKRRDYVNVHYPGIRARLASVHVGTGSTEFQIDSWSSVRRDESGWRRLDAGNKAATYVADLTDIDRVTTFAQREIARRLG